MMLSGEADMDDFIETFLIDGLMEQCHGHGQWRT